MKWKELLSIVLLWIAWAAVITATMALAAADWTLLALAALFLAVAAGLMFAARALTASWYSQLIAVTILYALMSVIRAIAERERGGEMMVVAGISLGTSAILAIARRFWRGGSMSSRLE
jgi:hypothetical protein